MAEKHTTPRFPFNRRDAVLLSVCVLSAAAVYLNTLRGDFIYDDVKQIVGNRFIQESQFFWTGLTSDVWAFKGDRPNPWSNYWRPAFVAWLRLNYSLFGLDSTLGWHLTNIALHALVVALSFVVIRLLGVSSLIAAAIALVFAVHPVHVESVAWISGSPDLLLAVFGLGSLCCVIRSVNAPSRFTTIAGWFLYIFALLSKEISILFPVIVLVIVAALRAKQDADRSHSGKPSWRYALPYAILAVAYLGFRFAILGRSQIDLPWRHNAFTILLTLPSILTFYLRQCVFPLWMGPSYPLRVVQPGSIGLSNFVIPVAVVAVFLLIAGLRSQSCRICRIGAVCFLLLLAPAMNINAFLPEQLVHDRYLYLPLLGLLLLAFHTGSSMLTHRYSRLGEKAGVIALGFAVLVSIPLSIRTIRYNKVWCSELALWECGIQIDPGSAFNWTEYGVALVQAHRPQEALDALNKSLAIEDVSVAYVTRARIATLQGRFDDARKDLELVLKAQPDNATAYEYLADCYAQQNRFEDAVAVMRRGRENTPDQRCPFTTNLAIALYRAGKREEALAELTQVRESAARDLAPLGRAALFYLGKLHDELGEPQKARPVLQEYLNATVSMNDALTQNLRREARGMLARMTP